jgi:Uma2 family endonuclease
MRVLEKSPQGLAHSTTTTLIIDLFKKFIMQKQYICAMRSSSSKFGQISPKFTIYRNFAPKYKCFTKIATKYPWRFQIFANPMRDCLAMYIDALHIDGFG